MMELLKCVAIPSKQCKNKYMRQLCKQENIPLCIIAEVIIRVDDDGVLHGYTRPRKSWFLEVENHG